MNDLDALRAAVLANPDEDTPRLIFADALDELGEPYAETRARTIRRMVAGECADTVLQLILQPTWDSVFWEANGLNAQYYARSDPDAAYLKYYVPVSNGSIRRGFIGHVETDPGHLEIVLATMRKHSPIESIRLYNWRGYQPSIGLCLGPWIRSVEFSVSDSQRFHSHDVEAFAAYSVKNGYRNAIREFRCESMTPRGVERASFEFPNADIFARGFAHFSKSGPHETGGVNKFFRGTEPPKIG